MYQESSIVVPNGLKVNMPFIIFFEKLCVSSFLENLRFVQGSNIFFETLDLPQKFWITSLKIKRTRLNFFQSIHSRNANKTENIKVTLSKPRNP